ncbi:hypothetical protein RIF29_07768 [Crotalaria pallida]|uniref:Uncharacterized protein n=1 Tax=Crotalaria pallida TaxID=3830 RepID=A0AAN9PAY8_CROPI
MKTGSTFLPDCINHASYFYSYRTLALCYVVVLRMCEGVSLRQILLPPFFFSLISITKPLYPPPFSSYGTPEKRPHILFLSSLIPK